MFYNRLLFLLISLTLLISCNNGDKMSNQTSQFPDIKDVPNSVWEKLSQKKIYFGHQSVGFNIIDGIKDVMKEYPQIKLNIVETTDPSDFNSPVFAHSRIGKNVDPKSKIDSFAENLKLGIGEKVDIAFLKFCYVDIKKGSDIEDIFQNYQKKMKQLEKDYPRAKFIHLTVPLRVTKTNWKTWIKEKSGKGEMYEYAGNIERNEYNEFLLKNYSDKEPVFNLSKIESTYQDGRRSSFSAKGKLYYSLVPEYTKDGGHLNELGRKIVAEQFLIYLANL